MNKLLENVSRLVKVDLNDQGDVVRALLFINSVLYVVHDTIKEVHVSSHAGRIKEESNSTRCARRRRDIA